MDAFSITEGIRVNTQRIATRWEIIRGLPKSLIFNMKYFPFKTALRMPVLLSHRVILKNAKGSVQLNTDIRRSVFIGFTDNAQTDNKMSRTIWNVTGEVTFNGHANIGSGSSIVVYGKLKIGDSFNISGDTTVLVKESIDIGNNVLISWDVLIMDYDLHQVIDTDGNKGRGSIPIRIGNDNWIGARTTILKGTRTGNGCVIGANSLLNKEYSEDEVLIAGVPGRILKRGITWLD